MPGKVVVLWLVAIEVTVMKIVEWIYNLHNREKAIR